MTEQRDDELHAMLEARADRLPSAAGREVLAAVREEVRGPKGGAEFAVLPVTRVHGMNGPAGWAAIGLVAVLVLAVMGGRLTTDPAQPSAGSGATGSPAATTGASTSPATQVAASPAIPTVTMDQLRRGLEARTLEGRTILVTGRLEVQPWPCPSPMPDDCYGLQMQGLDGVEIDHAGVLTAAEAFARIPGDTTDRPMAFRVTGGQLAMLGWITRGAETPLTVNGLAADAPGRAEVAIVSGWLIPPPTAAECPPPRDPNTPCGRTTPLLSDAPPMPDGTYLYAQGINVGLDPSVAFGPDGAALPGPFLVRHMAYRGGDLPPYQVVARLDPATTVRVGQTPTPAAMTGEQLRAAVEDGSLDGRLITVTSWLQRSGALCPADLPQPCTAFVILGLEGISVTWDGPVATTTRLGGDASPAPSTAGTLVVTPHDGRLLLLGRLPGNLERPSPLQELLYQRRLMVFDDPFALTAVAGWLVVGGIHSCPMLGPGATPCPGPPPALTDEEPFPDGMLRSDVQTQVGVWPDAVGIDPRQVVTPGPFLYRVAGEAPCAGPACPDVFRAWTWEVMARYDIGSVNRVVLP